MNVTGLICACDLLGQLPADLSGVELLIPDVMFNYDGHVNVTGLICACDLLGQLPADLSGVELLIPDVMFNYDGLTLDGLTRDAVTSELEGRGAVVHYATPAPNLHLDALM